jgi:hypothetical protein
MLVKYISVKVENDAREDFGSEKLMIYDEINSWYDDDLEFVEQTSRGILEF